MPREIRLIAFNRPAHTRQCVDHLLRCRGLDRWRVVASVDGLPNGKHNSGVVEQLRRIPGVDLRLRKRLKMNGHIRANWTEFLREGSDSFLHLEDDIILAADALEFCEKHHGKLQPDGQCASLTLLGHRPNTLEQARKVVDVTATIDRLFVCYGVYLRQPVVETIVKNWRGGWSYWDIGITDWYRCWKWKTLVPVLPRARNIGYSPGSPLDKRVHRPIWSGDLVN